MGSRLGHELPDALTQPMPIEQQMQRAGALGAPLIVE